MVRVTSLVPRDVRVDQLTAALLPLLPSAARWPQWSWSVDDEVGARNVKAAPLLADSS